MLNTSRLGRGPPKVDCQSCLPCTLPISFVHSCSASSITGLGIYIEPNHGCNSFGPSLPSSLYAPGPAMSSHPPAISLIMPTIDWGATFQRCVQAAAKGLGEGDQLLVVFDGTPSPPATRPATLRRPPPSTGRRSPSPAPMTPPRPSAAAGPTSPATS